MPPPTVDYYTSYEVIQRCVNLKRPFAPSNPDIDQMVYQLYEDSLMPKITIKQSPTTVRNSKPEEEEPTTSATRVLVQKISQTTRKSSEASFPCVESSQHRKESASSLHPESVQLPKNLHASDYRSLERLSRLIIRHKVP